MLILILIFTIFSPNHISCDETKFPADLKFNVKLNLNEATMLGDGKLLGLQRGSSGHVDELKAGSYEWQTVWDKYISGYKPAVIRGGIKNSNAISAWTDKYLLDKYGDEHVQIERKNENRFRNF